MKNWKALLLLTALGLLILLAIFGNVLLQPGQYMFGYLEDGTKNYYTAAYFVKYDSGVWFTGMNYPFGEHITYTDSQPLFATVLSSINRHIAPIAQFTIGFYNVFMLAGLLLCAWFLYLILKDLKLPVWYAIAAALLIAFLSPQLFRIRSHYALGYAFIIPLCWYLIIRIFQQPRAVKWYLVYAITGLLIALVHPYYALINLLLLFSYVLVYFLQEKKRRPVNLKLIFGLLAAVLVPIVTFQLFMHFTDPVPDRPESPYGFVAYRTGFKALFFPLEEPLRPLWQAVFGSKEPIWEGYAYVGQAAFFVLILTLIKYGKYARRKAFRLIFRPVLPAPLRTGIWASVLVLLFALAIPIKWGMEGILDIVPPLKQFRSIGRFAWIFYYVLSVYAAYYLYQLYRKFRLQRRPQAAWLILLLPLAFWSFEALNNVYQKAQTIKANRLTKEFTGEAGNYTELLQKHNHRASDFQAILPLPYFNVGSEKVTLFPDSESPNEAMKASLNTGLPIATALLSRTSLSQCLQQLQLLSSPYTPKEILNRYPNRKPLLLLVMHDSLAPAEKNLVQKASLLVRERHFNLYSLPLDSLEAQPATRTGLAPLPSGLVKTGDYYVSSTAGTVIRQNYAHGDPDFGMYQLGALHFKERKTILIDTVLQAPAAGQTYELSAWARVDLKNMPSFSLELTTPDGKQLSEEKINFGSSSEIWDTWVMTSHRFHLPAGQVRIVLMTKSRQAVLDDLLLRPVTTDVYFYGTKKGILVKNNRPASF